MRTNRRPIAIMRRSCSDSLLTASHSDGVFGSDNDRSARRGNRNRNRVGAEHRPCAAGRGHQPRAGGSVDGDEAVFGDHLNIGAAPTHPGVGHRNERNAVGRSFLDRRFRRVKQRKLATSTAYIHETPMRRSGCCARAASGRDAAAPPISVMNWRRFRSIASSAHANTTGASRSGLPIRIVARRRNSVSPARGRRML